MFSSKNYTANAMFECKQETEEQPEEIKRPRLEQWPPPYSELGKRAKNLFTKFYDVGLLKLDISTKTPDNITFSTSTVKNIEQDKMSGSLEAKYEFADGGITAVEKFNTDRILLTEISFKDKILEGLKFSVSEFVNPKTKGAKSVIKAEFKRQKVAMNADFEYDGDKIYQLTASLVLAHQGLVGGFQTKFDFNQSMLADFSLALGYSNADFILHTSVKGGTDYEGSIFHKVAPNLDAGVDIAWFSNKEETIFGVAGQYEFNENISIRGKVNNVNELGLGYRQKLREGITLTMSCLFNLTSINDGNHKIGLGMQLEA